jgi:GT2 family glycosyltransferase
MNMALREASGRYVVIFNDDTLLISNAFYDLIKFMDSNPQFGAVGPKLLNTDGTFQIGPRGPANLWTILCWELKLYRLFPKSRLLSGFEMTYWDQNRSCEIQTVSGCCVLVRKEVLEQIGILEERIPLGPDDIEFSYRIRKAEWKLYYLANVEIIHHGGASVLRTDVHAETLVKQAQGWFWFWKHHFGWLQVTIYRLIAIAGVCIRVPYWSFIYLIDARRRSRASCEIRGRFGIFLLSLSLNQNKFTL